MELNLEFWKKVQTEFDNAQIGRYICQRSDSFKEVWPHVFKEMVVLAQGFLFEDSLSGVLIPQFDKWRVNIDLLDAETVDNSSVLFLGDPLENDTDIRKCFIHWIIKRLENHGTES